jgi:hypothetical protein
LKVLLFISILALVAWYGLGQYAGNREYTAEQSGPYTEAVEYQKCTSADGQVIYGQPPVGTKCLKNEIIKSEITIMPSIDVSSSNLAGSRSIATGRYRCDGRQHCSQMTSREEAVYFVNNCPNTIMDGDHDGVPCENDTRF